MWTLPAATANLERPRRQVQQHGGRQGVRGQGRLHGRLGPVLRPGRARLPHVSDGRARGVGGAHVSDGHMRGYPHVSDRCARGLHVSDGRGEGAHVSDGRVRGYPHVSDGRMRGYPHVSDGRMRPAPSRSLLVFRQPPRAKRSPSYIFGNFFVILRSEVMPTWSWQSLLLGRVICMLCIRCFFGLWKKPSIS